MWSFGESESSSGKGQGSVPGRPSGAGPPGRAFKLWRVWPCVLALGAVLLISAGAQADTCTFTGHAGDDPPYDPPGDASNWFDARNWDVGHVPGAADDAVIGGTFNVHVDQDTTVNNLTFSPTNSIYPSFGPRNGATLTVAGTFTWTAGGIGNSGDGVIHILSGAQWNISGPDQKKWHNSTAQVINDGTAIWSGGDIDAYQSLESPIINNGTFTATSDGSMTVGTADHNFVNNGRFIKNGGSGLTSVAWQFANHGVVDVQTGTVDLTSGSFNGGAAGTTVFDDGSFNTAPGTLMEFAGGTHILTDNARFTGGGVSRITGGVVVTQGTPQIGTSTGAAGTFEIATGGALNSSLSISPIGALVCSGTGTLLLTGGNVGGPVNIQAGGTANWTGGEFDGTLNIAQGATLNISGAGTHTVSGYRLQNNGLTYLPGILNNAGTVNWSGACNIDFQYGDPTGATRGVINNSGLFVAQNDQDFTGSGLFQNLTTGIFRKASGTLTRFAPDTGGFTLKSSGTLDVQAGVVSLNGNSNAQVFNAGTTLSGAGRTRLDVGYLIASGNFTLAKGGTFEVAGGNLAGPPGPTAAPPAAFSGPGTFAWTGGTISALANIGAGTTLAISGPAAKTLDGYRVGNNGYVNQPGILNNAGTATWTGTGAIESNSGGPLSNLSGGTFNMQTTAALGTSFTNSGIVNIGTATAASVLNVNGNYSQTATGVLNLKIGGRTAGTQFDQVQVGGQSHFAGTLNTLLSNGFTPAATDRFAVIMYPSHSGTFGALNGPFRADYQDPNLYLTLNPTAPRIISFTPGSGVVGATVTITGANLTGAAVTFNGVRAIANTSLSTATRLVVTVPTTAKTGPIRVATSAGSAVSATNFTVVVPVRYTISGSVTSGTAPLQGVSGPVPNVPVFLVSRANLPALLAVAANPSLLANSTSVISRTTTNTAGQYSFTALPGSYYVAAAQPGVFFNPVLRTVNVINAAVPNQNFSGVGVDNVAPSVAISTGTATTVTGSASDATSGVLTVIVTLQNSANQYLNWSATGTTAQFTASPSVNSYRAANATGSTVPLLNLNKVATQGWTVALPANLPVGSYRVTARAIDRAFRVSVPVQRIVTKVSAPKQVRSPLVLSSAIASAATGSVTLRFSGAVDADSASDAAHYSLLINGRAISVVSASYNSSTHVVTVAAPEGAFGPGAAVALRWSELLDAAGGVSSGESPPLTAR